jgi:FAD:protein FMN transferase
MRPMIGMLCVLAGITGCGGEKRMEARGYAQGTTYSVIYYNDGTDLQYQIDSILVDFDRVLSTYQPNSFISRWNRNVEHDSAPAWFNEVVGRSQQVSEHTAGAFDITVKPLMDFWFGRNWDASALDTAMLDSVRQFVGRQKLRQVDGVWTKVDDRVQLDVNAIAQGFSVDVVASYLEGRGVAHYLVEIGGEVRAKGQKPDGGNWTVGVDRPNDDGNSERTLALSIQLKDQAMATSGNYRKYVELNGEKLGHSLNPHTGMPAMTDVLSATVVAADAMTADAYATAFMVMGVDASKFMLSHSPELHGILIYSQRGELLTWVSEGLVPQIVN